VGNAKEVAKGLEKYGEIKYFNVYGQEVAAPTAKTVDASVTPQGILQKAIEAYGGQSAIAGIKDLQMTGKASIMGRDVTVTQKNIVPSGFLQELSMQGMVLQKKLMKDGQFTATAQGQSLPVEEKEKEEMMEDAVIFTEPYLLSKSGYQFNLKGIEQVEGKDAYVLGVKTPAGREFTNYYDVASGLMVKKSMTQESPMGSMTVNVTVADYKPFNGVLIPTRINNDLGAMKFDITFDDVKVNSGLKAEDLK
jgi:hypothetical protein